MNQLIIVTLANGDIFLRNPAGEELLRYETGLSDIIAIATP